MTPGSLSKSDSVHQKQPDANVATAIPGFGVCVTSVLCPASMVVIPTKAPPSHR